MSPLTESTRLTLAKTYVGIDDPDAAVYIAAVESADGQVLETATRVAIHSFVKGCKADGIWPAIKASCILAGARTLAGALVPLTGTAPTNVGPFVSGDYNRKTGLIGNGSTKYIDSQRACNADPQNNYHLSIFLTAQGANDGTSLIRADGSGTASKLISPFGTIVIHRALNSVYDGPAGADWGSATKFWENKLIGHSRASAANYQIRERGINFSFNTASNSPNSTVIRVCNATSSRIAFYSIGEALNLASLDTRVSALITAFGVAIP